MVVEVLGDAVDGKVAHFPTAEPAAPHEKQSHVVNVEAAIQAALDFNIDIHWERFGEHFVDFRKVRFQYELVRMGLEFFMLPEPVEISAQLE